jgi:hypothetical protein
VAIDLRVDRRKSALCQKILGASYGLLVSAFRSIGAQVVEGRVGFEPTTPGLKVRDPSAESATQPHQGSPAGYDMPWR